MVEAEFTKTSFFAVTIVNKTVTVERTHLSNLNQIQGVLTFWLFLGWSYQGWRLIKAVNGNADLTAVIDSTTEQRPCLLVMLIILGPVS